MFYCRDGIDQRVEARNDSIIAHVITLLYCRINRDPMIMEDRQLILTSCTGCKLVIDKGRAHHALLITTRDPIVPVGSVKM